MRDRKKLNAAGAAGWFVKTAFAFEAKETGLLRRQFGGERTRRVRIADGNIALIPKRMIREAVFRQITMNVAIAPFDDRMNFGAAVLASDDVEGLARRRLGTTQTGEPS